MGKKFIYVIALLKNYHKGVGMGYGRVQIGHAVSEDKPKGQETEHGTFKYSCTPRDGQYMDLFNTI